MHANSSSQKRPSQSGRTARTAGENPRCTLPRRGKLFELLWPMTSYVLTNVTVTILEADFSGGYVFSCATVAPHHDCGGFAANNFDVE